MNGFPWSSSYAAWGGYLKVKPTAWYYAITGLYLAIPEASQRGNHGLDFEGFGRKRAGTASIFWLKRG